MRKFQKILAAVLLSVFCVTAFSACSGGSAEKVAVKAVEARYVDFDAEAFIDCVQEEFVEYVCEDEDIDLDELIENLQEDLDERQEYLEDKYGDYEIEVAVKDEDELDEDDIDEIDDELRDLLDLDDHIEEAMVYEIEVTVIDEDGDEHDEDVEVIVYKYGSSWYVYED